VARSLRDIKRQIKSVQSTQQITRAMKMVAAAKLRRAQARMLALRPYANDMAEILAPVLAEAAGDEHAFLRPGQEGGKIGLVFVAADRGLCGGFNMNLVRRAERFLAEDAAGRPVALICVGRKAWDHARRRRLDVIEHYEDVFDQVPFSLAASLADRVAARFESGELAEVHLLHAEFVSAMKQVQIVRRLLPLDPEALESALPRPADPHTAAERHAPVPPGEAAAARGAGGEPTLEPALAPLADALLRRFLATQVHRALLESYASELGARMTAMEAATENAEDMIARLTLDYNRARQATITKELLDIVGGAEAMKA